MTRSISCLLLALFYSVAVQAQLQFKTPGAVLLQNPIGGAYSPTLRDGELELFFESAGDLYHAQRSSSDILFPTVLRVDELSTTTFIEENPFLSVDGLRLYFTRRSRTSQNRDILVASRENFTSPFGAPGAVGPVTNPPFRGRLGSLTGDELKIYLEIPRSIPPGSGTPLTEHTDIATATRENTSQRFGMWQFLPMSTHWIMSVLPRSPGMIWSLDTAVSGRFRICRGPCFFQPVTTQPTRFQQVRLQRV
ncbi:MAG: PD40 domain-containing protein [Candidatus Omnitrophica bacterium]|nr:PD40 domain-containing protein [Candidatus Omnitrophota bacterium]